MQRDSKPSAARLLFIGLALVAVIGIAAALIVPRAMRPSGPEADLARQVMRSDLRGLATLEHTTRRLLGRYTSDPANAGHLSSVGVNTPIVTLVDSGYTAVVTHREIPRVTCAMGVYARNPLSRWARSGEIVCR